MEYLCRQIVGPMRVLPENPSHDGKSELATDFLEYGKNAQVDRVICLVYDPAAA